MTAATRARGAEFERRLDAVEELLTRCASQREIAEFCRDKWGLTSRSQVKTYVARVHERWEKERHRTRAEARARAIRRLERIVRTAYEGDELRTALAALDLLSRVEGTVYTQEDAFADAGSGKLELKITVIGEDECDRIRAERRGQSPGPALPDPKEAA
jgi:hypothetical protein